MPDDLTKRGKPDRTKVAGQEPWEVRVVAKKLNVTQDAVKAAVKKVGPSRVRVEAELRKKGK